MEQQLQPLIYTPTQPKPVAQPLPVYELKKDSSGEPSIKRGVQQLFAIRQDKDGKPLRIPFKVPYAPKSKCKKCFGRGYVGFDLTNNIIHVCGKCYPKH